MRLYGFGGAVCGAILLVAGDAYAGDPPLDCKNAVTQTDLNICAGRDYEAADKELNDQYKKTRATMVTWDSQLEGNLKGAEKALVKAQRAWIDYRDGQCAAEGFQARGGTLESMLVGQCKAKLTRQRTKELADLADGLEK